MNNHVTSTSTKAITIIIIILVIITAFIGIRDYKQDKQYNHEAYENHVEVVNNEKQTKQLSKHKAIKQFETSEPNIDLVKKNTRARITKAVGIACTKLANDKDVNKYRHIITLYLGNQAGNDLISDTEPVHAEFSGRQSQKLLDLKIGFGKFNNTTKALPMNVLIKYRTSRFRGGLKSQNKPRVYYDAFTYDVKSSDSYDVNLKLLHHVRSENNDIAQG